MTCPNCGGQNVTIQAVAERKKRGCLMAGLWLLLAILTFGAVIWIPLLVRKGDKVRSWAVCQSCGYRWVMERPATFQPMQPVMSNEPRFDTLVPNVQTALSQLLDGDIGVSESERDWMITRTGLKYILSSNIKVKDIHRQARIEIDFPDATYDTFYVTNLQLDGETIEL